VRLAALEIQLAVIPGLTRDPFRRLPWEAAWIPACAGMTPVSGVVLLSTSPMGEVGGDSLTGGLATHPIATS